MAKLYHDNGYVNMDYVSNQKEPFISVIGGRGTGKTFGALKDLLERSDCFIFLRRTQTQADILSKKEFQPFNALPNSDLTTNKLNKYVTGFYHTDDEGYPSGDPVGYLCALSTFASIRGIDFSKVTKIIYDEFIPETHERPIKNEAQALWNVYETVNRNREIQGKDAVKLIMLSNSNTINNPIFISLGITDSIAKMQHKGVEVMRFNKKHLVIFDLQYSKISEKKKATVLYQLTESDESFSDMALSNKFADVPDNVSSADLKQYILKYQLDNMYIYKHKSEMLFYITTIRSGTPLETYTDSSLDITAFKMSHKEILMSYYGRTLFFTNVSCALKFKNMLNL